MQKVILINTERVLIKINRTWNISRQKGKRGLKDYKNNRKQLILIFRFKIDSSLRINRIIAIVIIFFFFFFREVNFP